LDTAITSKVNDMHLSIDSPIIVHVKRIPTHSFYYFGKRELFPLSG